MGRYRFVDGVRAEFTAEEEIARDAEEAAWVAGAVDRAWATLREERNARLTETDWWASSDLTMTSEQTEYRQVLRDLPSIVDINDWPDITWPTPPE